MKKAMETHTILVKLLVRDLRTGGARGCIRYLRVVEIDSDLRGFQEKLEYTVEEFKSFLFFKWWKILSVDAFFNFTEAKPHLQNMLDAALQVDVSTRNKIIVVDCDFNPDIGWV